MQPTCHNLAACLQLHRNAGLDRGAESDASRHQIGDAMGPDLKERPHAKDGLQGPVLCCVHRTDLDSVSTAEIQPPLPSTSSRTYSGRGSEPTTPLVKLGRGVSVSVESAPMAAAVRAAEYGKYHMCGVDVAPVLLPSGVISISMEESPR
jgi:hypothetical protein